VKESCLQMLIKMRRSITLTLLPGCGAPHTSPTGCGKFSLSSPVAEKSMCKECGGMRYEMPQPGEKHSSLSTWYML
jgi:hypothetical protein